MTPGLRAPRSRVLATVAAFAAGLSLPVAAGYYGHSVSGRESVKVALTVPGPAGKPATVDVGGFTDLKKAVQPWHFRIFTAVTNASTAPLRIGLRVDDCRLFFDWRVRNHTWDAETRAVAAPVPPGGRLTFYLFAEVPEALRREHLLCDGSLVAFAPETGETMAVAPLRIVNGSIAGAAAGDHDHSSDVPMPDGAMHVH